MRTRKGFTRGLIAVVSIFICLAWTFGNASASQPGFSTLYSFTGAPNDGTYPFGSLTLSGSTFYGMTNSGGSHGGGTIFRIDTDGSGYQVLHSFGSIANDGANPHGSLTLSGSTLYGMTFAGGVYDEGAIFKINTDGTGYKVLHSFAGEPNDGAYPYGSLTLSGSTLYGMTSQGGDAADIMGYKDSGTIFKINTNGSAFQVLFNFGSIGSGTTPYGSLTLAGSTLYGTTCQGGDHFSGTIFRINTDGSEFRTLYSFNNLGSDGGNPFGSLTLSGSTLYGMTIGAGGSSEGTIFDINTDGSGYKVLYDFAGPPDDAAQPNGSLVLAGSTLYGMSWFGGANDKGAIFQINTDGSGYRMLYSFTSAYQYNTVDIPGNSLTLFGSTLYGMTEAGGTNHLGAIFSFTGALPASKTTTDLASNPNPSTFGQSVTFTATVSPSAATGTVSFYDGSTQIGTTQTLSGGRASISTSSLSVGTHSITAVYSGDSNYDGSSSNPLTLAINATAVNGACGSANGQTFATAPTSNLCNAGSPSSITGAGPWSWTCEGENGGANASCSANIQSVNGACGSANGQTLATAPTSNLCNAGSPSTVTGAGPWNWTCEGENGGANASCSANIQSVSVNGACGSANGQSLTTAPTSNLCNAGNPSTVTGAGPWNWTCQGSNGGSTVNCSANIESGASTYTFTTLDDPNAVYRTYANGINKNGDIVGFYVDKNGVNHGFKYSSGNGYTTLDDPSGANGSLANGIDASGDVVGSFEDSSGNYHGFLYNGSTYIPLDDPDGVSTWADGISGDGLIVGPYHDYFGTTYGYIYDGSTYTPLDAPFGVADGINDSGDIVGYYDTASGFQGLLYTGGTPSTLDDPSGVSTFLTAINDSGDIVGYYTDSSGDNHSFLYSGGSYKTIDVPNAKQSQALGINDNGDIVGNYTDSTGDVHGFLATSKISGLWQNATPTGGGWYYLSPFGAFNTNNSPWMYHKTLGWLYPLGTSTDNIWFYDPQWDGTGGWWWTSDSLFPWIYSATEGEWLYYNAAASDPYAFQRWFATPSGQWATH